MKSHSTYTMTSQATRDHAFMATAAHKTCATLWTAPLCVRITRKVVAGLNGPLAGVF